MYKTDKKQLIRVLKSPTHYGQPVWKEGEIVIGCEVSPLPGYRGFKGWIVRADNNDCYEYFLEEGSEAELIDNLVNSK